MSLVQAGRSVFLRLGDECAPPHEPHVSFPIAGRVSSAYAGHGGTWRGSPPRSGQPPGKACLSFHKRLRGLGRRTVSDGKFSAFGPQNGQRLSPLVPGTRLLGGVLAPPTPPPPYPRNRKSWGNGLRPGPRCSCQPRQIQLCFHVEAGVLIPGGGGFKLRAFTVPQMLL